MAAGHLWAVPLTGAGMNPARSRAQLPLLPLLSYPPRIVRSESLFCRVPSFPPRSLGASLGASVTDSWSRFWVYSVAPILGGALAGTLYTLVFAVSISCLLTVPFFKYRLFFFTGPP